MVLLLLTVYVDAFSCVRYRWLKLRDASTDLAIILCQRTLKIPRVEFYTRIEPSVLCSVQLSLLEWFHCRKKALKIYMTLYH